MRTRFVLALFSVALATSVAAQSSLQAQADAAYAKLQAVMRTVGQVAKAPARRTVFSQTEMNAYLRFRANTWLPTGITEPSVQFIGGNRITTVVTADLDGVRKKSSGGWFDPTAYLSGRLPVHVTGTLATSAGKVRFLLEQAAVDGIPVPRVFIAELLAFYTRSADNPAGVRLEEPFELPSEIERIDVTTGQAVVIQ